VHGTRAQIACSATCHCCGFHTGIRTLTHTCQPAGTINGYVGIPSGDLVSYRSILNVLHTQYAYYLYHYCCPAAPCCRCCCCTVGRVSPGRVSCVVIVVCHCVVRRVSSSCRVPWAVIVVMCRCVVRCDAVALAIHVMLSLPFSPAIAVVIVMPWHWPSASHRHRSHQPLSSWSLSGCCGHAVVVALAICISSCHASSPSLSS